MNAHLSDPALWSRVQFGFTVTYHDLCPQLTMGWVWFLVYWTWRALRTGDEKYNIWDERGVTLCPLCLDIALG